MLRFRPKLGSERNSEWRCCFCLHVRTGTILLGTWHLMLHLIALGFLAAIVRDPRLLDELERDSAPVADWSDVARVNDAMPTPLSNVESPQHVGQPRDHSLIYRFLAAIVRDPRLLDELERDSAPVADWSDVARVNDAMPTPLSNVESPQHVGQPRDHSLIYHDVDVGALVTVCTLAITFMLIYGAALGKPAHLLPFFCLQIFDFAITVLTATGYLCYLRSIHRLVAETRRVPWRAQLLQLPAPALALVVLSAFLVAVLLKGYCISVVWRCYKYLTMRAHALQTPFVISSDDVVTTAQLAPYTATPAPDYSSLLPDYEEAVKQTPPPSYRAATLMAAADPSLTTVQERAQNEQSQPQPQSQPQSQPQPLATNTMVVLPQNGTQARV